MKSSIEIIHESTETENKVLDLLIKNGCSNEDLLNVSSMLQTIYMCGFEVGKGCIVKWKFFLAIETSWN